MQIFVYPPTQITNGMAERCRTTELVFFLSTLPYIFITRAHWLIQVILGPSKAYLVAEDEMKVETRNNTIYVS